MKLEVFKINSNEFKMLESAKSNKMSNNTNKLSTILFQNDQISNSMKYSKETTENSQNQKDLSQKEELEKQIQFNQETLSSKENQLMELRTMNESLKREICRIKHEKELSKRYNMIN